MFSTFNKVLSFFSDVFTLLVFKNILLLIKITSFINLKSNNNI